MRIKKARQILKSFADDTRLRIINLLNHQELNVSQLCGILQKNQPNISKHLLRLRLTGIVGDKRQSSNVYYYLHRPADNAYACLLDAVTRGLADMEVFLTDLQRLKNCQITKNPKRRRNKE